jgi:hypothetical protein
MPTGRATRTALLALLLVPLGADACSHKRNSGAEPDGGTETGQTPWPAGLPPLKFLRRMPETGPPKAFILHPDTQPLPDEFIERYARALWGLSAADELRPSGIHEGLTGAVRTKYQQYHAGYLVEDGSFVLTTQAGRVDSCAGRPVGALDKLEVEVRVPEQTAIDRARERLASALGQIATTLRLGREPEVSLLILRTPRRLAWRVLVEAPGPVAARQVDVDAATGEVLQDGDALWGERGRGPAGAP